jgi:hypothetical protein
MHLAQSSSLPPQSSTIQDTIVILGDLLTGYSIIYKIVELIARSTYGGAVSCFQRRIFIEIIVHQSTILIKN